MIDGERRLVLFRYAIVAPPVLAGAASVPLLVASLFAWGAASEVDYPAALPTVAGLAAAMPILMIGLVSARAVWRRAQHRFDFYVLFTTLGALAFVGAAAFQLALATRIGSRETYKELRPDQLSPAGFLFVSLSVTSLGILMLSYASFLYVMTVTPGPGIRRQRDAEVQSPPERRPWWGE